MPDSVPAPAFAELVCRHLDGRLSAGEQKEMARMLVEDEARAQEFASIVRFEAILRKACRRDAKALLEFVAMEATSAPASTESRARWRIAATPWLRVAAALVALACLTALWLSHEGSPPAAPAAVASAPAPPLIIKTTDRHKVVMLAPRASAPKATSHAPATADPAPSGAAAPDRVPTLAERLDDFYLPEVSLREVPAQQAVDWLATQLREHNHAKRADLDHLMLEMPRSAAARLVTLESGPITFKKAVEIVASLAGSEATVTADSVQIVDREAAATAKEKHWRSSPWNEEDTRRYAAAIGIPPDSAIGKAETGGGVSLQVTEGQQRALTTLAGAQKQLESLAPLSFVPLLLPADANGGRILTSAEVTAIREQLSTALAGTLPVVTLPLGSATGETAPLLDRKGTPVLSLKATPVGEMNQVTIEAATPATTPSDLLATTTPPAPAQAPPAAAAVDALLNTDQGVVVTLNAATGTLYTADGIPVPSGYEYLYGYSIAVSADGTATLVLVPVP